MGHSVFALVDCNNFFVSCERLFRPDLAGKPTVVLSSNDGCVVARSNEAKELQVPMGAPAFQYRELFRKQQIAQFSANFELYGDISRRITALLTTVTPHIEVYSVDESFLDLSGIPIEDYIEWGRGVSALILQHVGVPVSIGIAGSKTLAKLASEVAKKDYSRQGAFSFLGLSSEDTATQLEKFPVQDIWGVGWRLAPKLRAEGVYHALSLANMSPRRAQQLMGVHGRQMVAELNGISCLPLTKGHDLAKSIMRSRTFGEDTHDPDTLESAITTMVGQAAFKLRSEKLVARTIGLFTATSRYKPGYRRWVREVHLDTPTHDPGLINSLLVAEFQGFFSSSQQYHRLGVFLYDLAPIATLQTDLLGYVDHATQTKSQSRMQAIDAVNQRWGKGTVHYAAEDLSTKWQPKHHIRSPRYVSQWNELPTARIV